MRTIDRFHDEVIIIGGGAGGIGLASAHKFIIEGASVILFDNNQEALTNISNNYNNKNLKPILIDITNYDAVSKEVANIWGEYGHINTFVSCVGISPKNKGNKVLTEEITENEWDEVFSINTKSNFLCAKAIIPYMKSQGNGQFVLVSSLAGRTTSPTAGLHYISSKAAILGMTKGLASELAPYGIRVNSISPGKVDTKMTLETDVETNKKYMDTIPLGRFADPCEVADVILFLASKESSYLIGTNIDVNGGRMMF
jgi:3-oxoacyl-[acyl-carrier protein] reductase